MKFQNFKNIFDVEKKLLRLIHIMVRESKIIQVSHSPDYSRSKYESMTTKTYFFNDFWNFEDDYNAIINYKITDIKGFHFDEIKQISTEYNVEYYAGDSFDLILNEVSEMDPDIMSKWGFDLDFDEFKLDDLSVERVDNINQKLHFAGTFTGDFFTVDPVDWKILVECSFDGLVSGDREGTFYADLIAEGYSLKNAGNYKLSYFLMFSALENYINIRLGSEKDSHRLLEKLKELFKFKFGDLGVNKIYTSIIGDFEKFENIRNKIAHGNIALNVDEELLVEMTIFVLIIIASYEYSLDSFNDLADSLGHLERSI